MKSRIVLRRIIRQLRRPIVLEHKCPSFTLRIRLDSEPLNANVLLCMDSVSIPLMVAFSGTAPDKNGWYELFRTAPDGLIIEVKTPPGPATKLTAAQRWSGI